MTTSNKDYLVIGLSGTNGAGKDSVGHVLEAKAGFKFISLTESLRHEATARQLPIERDVLREISREWRQAHGGGVLVDKAIEYYERAYRQSHPAGLVVASLRNHFEPDAVHNHGGLVVWVDGDPRVRYDRIQRDKALRGSDRAAEDNKTFDQFIAEENTEMFGYSDDPNALKTIDVKNKADRELFNNIMEQGEAGLAELWIMIQKILPEVQTSAATTV